MANKTKNIVTPVLIIIVLVLLSFVGYLLWQNRDSTKVGNKDWSGADIQEGLLVSIEKRKGKVDAPEYIKPETLQVVSLGEVSAVTDDGSIDVTVYDDGVTIVAAMLPGKDFGLVDIVIRSEEPELTVQSTAEAMVFMSPHLISSDPEQAVEIMNIIQNDAIVSKFVIELDRVLRDGKDPLEDPIALSVYGRAIESVLDKLEQ